MKTLQNETMPILSWWTVLAILPMLMLLPACSLFYAEPEKFTTRQDYSKTFKTVRDAIGHRYAIETADPEKGLIRTEWKVVPSALKTKRLRLISHIKRSEPEKGLIQVTLRSEVQKVESSLKSYDHEDAYWDNEPRNVELERDILSWIKMQMRVDEREETILEQAERGEKRDQRLEELNENQNPPPGE